jgi:hypothetical protein
MLTKSYLKVITLFALCFFFISCGEDTPEITQVLDVSFDTDENSSLMFYDGELEEEMTSVWRRYQIGNVLRVKLIDSITIEVANFAPVDIENATVLATIEGLEKQIQLFNIPKIRAHARQEMKYSFIEGSSMFLDVDGNEVDLTAYRTEGIPVDQISFTYTGTSELISKLKSLESLKWEIKFHNYDPDSNPNNNWADEVTGKDFRRFSGLIINMGYLFLSEEFKTGFLAEHLTKNDESVMTHEEKEELYQKLLYKSYFKCGKVAKISGLGGGAVLGFAEHILRDYLTKAATGSVTAHEVGHTLGYNHSSNMTYPIKMDGVNVGISPLAVRVMNILFEENRFPITLANYYLAEDFQEPSSQSNMEISFQSHQLKCAEIHK